ncbi:DUF2515 family protein [Virgibacillus ihumii]|uniref:DUF2515 family protein n=1 Tax=Virgibacillus ihumii TaxID=2686091 RepID=UPI00157D15AE|nr:DUF2515 family protein [Virgibacillus ihumii]
MHFNSKNHQYLHYITKKTNEYNSDNISRTNAYQNFYNLFPDIKWAFVASMVSRNAGWNMTDLFLSPFLEILGKKERNQLFMTYERANWLIFSDAYPQLLIFQLSVQKNKPMFHLLFAFHVSQYMVDEWQRYWEFGDRDRLMLALIINEQNVIQQPVIKQSYFKYKVFLRPPYLLQDILLLNAIILPTSDNKLFGVNVHDFTKLTNRILLGKKIASIIYNPAVYLSIYRFAANNEHTGSRRDYEKFFSKPMEKAPFLRTVYPVITHRDTIRNDWYKTGGIRKKWLKNVSADLNHDVSNSFYKKRKLFYAYYHVKKIL